MGKTVQGIYENGGIRLRILDHRQEKSTLYFQMIQARVRHPCQRFPRD